MNQVLHKYSFSSVLGKYHDNVDRQTLLSLQGAGRASFWTESKTRGRALFCVHDIYIMTRRKGVASRITHSPGYQFEIKQERPTTTTDVSGIFEQNLLHAAGAAGLDFIGGYRKKRRDMATPPTWTCFQSSIAPQPKVGTERT